MSAGAEQQRRGHVMELFAQLALLRHGGTPGPCRGGAAIQLWERYAVIHSPGRTMGARRAIDSWPPGPPLIE